MNNGNVNRHPPTGPLLERVTDVLAQGHNAIRAAPTLGGTINAMGAGARDIARIFGGTMRGALPTAAQGIGKARMTVSKVREATHQVAPHVRAYTLNPVANLPPEEKKKSMACCRGIFLSILYVLASLSNTIASVSLPWLQGTQTYLIQTEFNQNTFNGSLNGVVEVENITSVSVSLSV